MNNSKFFHNKKALSEFILDIWSYLVFATVIFFFLVLFKIQAVNSVQRELKGITDIPTSSSNLVDYLRTPVTIDGGEINIAELIMLWQLDPAKYRAALETNSTHILNKLEYEYFEPQTKNAVIRGFHVSINKEKKSENSIEPLIEFKSKSFQDGLCITNQYGCINLGEQFIPISNSQTLYIVLRESYKSK
ncbi:hypothetical protein HYX05_01000 [Candidatus Woesearchaeota archaeon]|nr:hypothetical protein [Candidatus Woesearchaeota archaeon]